jgi:predicted nucleic acid-binding protein
MRAVPRHVVIDSSVLTAICSGEAGRSDLAKKLLQKYAGSGCDFYSPGAIVPEVLYALCHKLTAGHITPGNYAKAVVAFSARMKTVLPPPNGDASLVARAEQIRTGYGCSRSADAIFIALAEELAKRRDTELITFDAELVKQAKRNAPTVKVRVL